MKTKVTITIEKETLKRVKQYAIQHNIIVSSVVEEYFKKLINPEEAIETNLM